MKRKRPLLVDKKYRARDDFPTLRFEGRSQRFDTGGSGGETFYLTLGDGSKILLGDGVSAILLESAP